MNLHQATETNHRQFNIKPNKSAKFRNPKTLGEDAVETSFDPDGEMAESGPTLATSSGFGGLWLDGMVGMEDPVGEGNSPPGEGKRGVMSGDNSVYGESEGPGNTDGAAEIVEALEGVFKLSSDVEQREGVVMKATVSGNRNQNEAIQIMRRIKAHYTSSRGQQLMCNDMVGEMIKAIKRHELRGSEWGPVPHGRRSLDTNRKIQVGMCGGNRYA